jgi:hypothetical protein
MSTESTDLDRVEEPTRKKTDRKPTTLLNEATNAVEAEEDILEKLVEHYEPADEYAFRLARRAQ